MRITVFGATGGTGRLLVRQALDAGHHVTAVVRDPSQVGQFPGADTVVADVTDPVAIETVVLGQDAVVSALGHRPGDDTPICANGARSIIAAMQATGTRRLVVITASGHVVDAGDGPFTRAVVKPMLRRFLRAGFADFARTDDLVSNSGLDWTIMRPPRLTDGKRRAYRTSLDVNVRGGIMIGRGDLADGILGALADPATTGHTVSLGY